jgi:anti-sigma regulatory factor (Ser/Thr protein kinase)
MSAAMSTSPTPPHPDQIRTDEGADRAMTLLPRDRRAPVDARDWLRAFLADRVPPVVAEDAALVLSELATNALRHGLGEVVARAALDADGVVQLSVTDSGGELPAMQPIDPTRVGGLGLRIVDQLSAAWGVAPFPGGKTVWATLRNGEHG